MSKRQTTGSALELDVDSSGGGGGGDVNITEVGGVSVTSPLPVDASGSSVSVTNFPATQPVSGPLTDAQLRATPVPVSATNLDIRDLAFAQDKVDVSGSSGVGVTGPLTDAQLRASAVPVSAASLPLPTGAATLAEQQSQTAVLGATTGAAVITDANGTIQQYLRGLVKLAITAGSFLVTATIAAGTNLIGRVSSSDETSTIYNGTTALTPKFAKISTSSSGASEVVAAVASKKIRVTQIVLMANAAVNVKFQSDGSPTDLTGLLYLAANTGFAPGYDPTGHFETLSGEALDINLSGAIAVGGWLKYIEV